MGLASLHRPEIHRGKHSCLSKYARMARLEKASMELNIPGMMAQGAFQPSLALIQKHRGQESGRAKMPRFFAEMRMIHFVDHVCGGGKGGVRRYYQEGGSSILKRVSSEQKNGITSFLDIPIYGASHWAW